MPALQRVAATWLASLACAGAAGAAELSACRADDARELGAACRSAISQSSVGDVLALIKPWLDARHYARALLVLQETEQQHPRNTLLKLRLHEVRSLADEADWLARKQAVSAEESEIDLALTETRCTRLAGEAALAACDQALQRRPDDARLLVARGDLLLTLGRTADAEAAYRVAAALDPALVLAPKIAIPKGAQAPILPSTAPSAMPVHAIAFGRYHALVIGNNAYQHLDRLDTAINDARTIASLLDSGYGFDVTLLTDATRGDIVELLDEYRSRLRASDNLLIYYAGHGWLDAEADKGFWLPVDARQDKRTQWVSNDTVRDALRALKAKHVLIVADSCFSGTLTRGAELKSSRSRDYVERMARLKARQVLTSGGLEPVSDSIGSGHSPFAAALIGVLQANRSVLDATSLFGELRRPVALNSEQVPQFADIRMAGHEGGDFLFVRRK